MVMGGNLFDAAIMKTSVISDSFRARFLEAPDDPDAFEGRAIVFDGPEDYRARIDDPAGVPVSEMPRAQKETVTRILKLYASNLRADLGEAHLSRIRRAGVERLHFAWAGGVCPGQKHYYRIHGPTHLVEYDNTQNDANHIHSVLRDLENDFGLDPLRNHYANCEHDS